jgi:hypothetical protein
MSAGLILRISYQENEAYASPPLTQAERYCIQEFLVVGWPLAAIAAVPGRHRATTWREVQRNRNHRKRYEGHPAHCLAPRVVVSPGGISDSPPTIGPVSTPASSSSGVRSRSACGSRCWISSGLAPPPSIRDCTRRAGNPAPCGITCGRGIGSAGDGPGARVRPRCAAPRFGTGPGGSTDAPRSGTGRSIPCSAMIGSTCW